MEIRYLTAEDAGEWLRLRLEALQGDPEAFSASSEEYQSLGLEEVRKRLGFEAKDAFVVGAFEDNRLQGCAGFYRDKGLKTRHKGRVLGCVCHARKARRGSWEEDVADAVGARRRNGWHPADFAFSDSDAGCSRPSVSIVGIYVVWM